MASTGTFRLAAYSRLGLFSRKLPGRNVPCWNRPEPFLCQPDGFFERDMSRHGQDGIVRCIKTVEKVFHFLQCSLSDVCNFLSDSRPAVWMRFVCQFTQQVRCIPVGLVQVALLELLNHHLALHFQTFRTEIQTEHAVAFQPESRFYVLVR